MSNAAESFFEELKNKKYQNAIKLLSENPEIVNARSSLLFGGQAGEKDFFEGRTHSILTASVNEGSIELVKELLKAGASVEDTGMFNETPLHTACWYGYVEIAKLLLEHKAPLEAVDSENNGTPITWALAGGVDGAWCGESAHAECIELLLSHGAVLSNATVQGISQACGPYTPALKTFLKSKKFELQ